MKPRVGVAVFGFGRIGMVHVKHLLMSTKVTIIWIVDECWTPKAKTFIEENDLSLKCTTPDKTADVLSDERVGAVIVCSPTPTHEPFSRLALEAGKAVFCEKPLTRRTDSSKALYALAKDKKLPLLCGFQRRFDPSFRRLKDDIKTMELGKLRLLKGSSHDFMLHTPTYFNSSGGLLGDATIHDLDMSLWICGGKPVSVYVVGNAFDPEMRKINDVDMVTVTIKYDNGVISVIDNGRQTNYGYDQRLEAICDKGTLLVTNRSMHQMYRFTSESLQMPECDKNFDTRYDDAYRNEIEHFLDVVQGNSELEVTESDTIAALELVEACNKSLEMGVAITFGDCDANCNKLPTTEREESHSN